MEQTLCEQLARDLGRDIRTGVFRPGDRMPSLRTLARTRGLALNTVKEAFLRLEQRGLVEARPRSGFYAREPEGPGPEPGGAAGAEARPPVPAGVTALWLQVHRDPGGGPFGLVRPDEGLLPRRDLGRLLAAAVRSDPGTGTPDLRGSAELRRQVARHYGEFGCSLDPGALFITAGTMDGVFLALQALTRAGDRILVESPFFTSALQLWAALGLELVEVPSDPVRGPDPGALAQAADRYRPAAAVLCPSFANPLGSLVPADSRRQIVEVCRVRGLPLIEDDVFGDLAYDAARPRPLKAWDTDGTVLLASSLAKTAAPGLRVGWLDPGRFGDRIEGLLHAWGPRAAGPVQEAAAAFLGRGGYRRHLERLRPELARRRDAAADAVEREFPGGTRVFRPRGGLVLWCELPGEAGTPDLAARARRQGISLLPGPLFTLGPGFRNGLRLNFARWDPGAARELAAVGALAREGAG